ncbi:MAG TPA: serine/threonine-protein kinase, partial [Phycisphaerae bacterium]|nr:serine/threonine-protein kinase [Phycisphaerae bacterium]
MKGSSLPTSWPQTGSISSRATVQKLAMVIARWERQSGTQIEDATLNERYAALMPDLRETLAYARQIASAARTMKSDDSGAPQASHPEDSRSPGPMVPGYEITEAIDHGGQGLIYKAIQDSTKKVVALKLLLDGPLSSERQRRRFTREVEIISRLSHPNIVPLLDSGSAHGRQFFAMEYIDGLPIDDYFLLNRGSLDGLVNVFEKVCRAVASAHQAGVIHRDLKPGNILVDGKGEPHILDFGLAKEFGDETGDEPRSLLSYTGQILGTLPYLSPEQAAAERQIDVRSDIYSLGVILYELVTG